MELVDGQPLSALLRGGRPLDPDVVRDLMAQAADAIGAAHQAGIVHRDVKPANLLVTPDRRIKITDFGIARASDGLGLTGTGQVMGTPQYLSPEQARGHAATPASDVYALGVVAFECLAGHRPFDAESPVATALSHLNDPVPDLPPDVPADLAAVVRRAMSKDASQRYADGAAFAAALRDPSAAVETAFVPVPPVSERTQVLSTTPPPAPALPPDPAPTPVADGPAHAGPPAQPVAGRAAGARAGRRRRADPVAGAQGQRRRRRRPGRHRLQHADQLGPDQRGHVSQRALQLRSRRRWRSTRATTSAATSTRSSPTCAASGWSPTPSRWTTPATRRRTPSSR